MLNLPPNLIGYDGDTPWDAREEDAVDTKCSNAGCYNDATEEDGICEECQRQEVECAPADDNEKLLAVYRNEQLG